MAHLTVSVEYAIHSLLWLVGRGATPLSVRELGELQGISPTFLAKIFPKLEKAAIVRSAGGLRGGYVLARPAEDISFLEIVDAIEGRKALFVCQEIRGRCAVFGDHAPAWATTGVCSVHVTMLRAEKAMRDTLAGQSLADLSQTVEGKSPPDFSAKVGSWIDTRTSSRGQKTNHQNPASPCQE